MTQGQRSGKDRVDMSGAGRSQPAAPDVEPASRPALRRIGAMAEQARIRRESRRTRIQGPGDQA